MSNLILPVKKKWFNLIKSGQKTEEYRLVNDYWKKRLVGKTYDRVIVTLGYPQKDDFDRRLVFIWGGFEIKTIVHEEFGNRSIEVFSIKLGCE